jgi:hypothetical protein
MRGIHRSVTRSKCQRLRRWIKDHESVDVKVSTKWSEWDEVEMTKVGLEHLHFWGLDYRGYREWMIAFRDIEAIEVD